MVRAEHRGNVPGIVHGSSTTGATLFIEPAATVEINNDIVELEDREREEIFRILLELTDRFRARPADMAVSRDVARELDVLQAKARYSSKSQRHRAGIHDRHQPAIEGGASPDAGARGAGRRAARSAESRPADHRSEYRRQDRGAEDGRAVRADGAGRPAPAGEVGATAGVPLACLPTSATNSRSRRASARSRRTSRTWWRWIASCSCRRSSCWTKSAPAPIPTKAARSPRRSCSTSVSAARW